MSDFSDYKSIGGTVILLPDGHDIDPASAIAAATKLPPGTYIAERDDERKRSELILGPDGNPAELPEPRPKHYLEFFAWEEIAIPRWLWDEQERYREKVRTEDAGSTGEGPDQQGPGADA